MNILYEYVLFCEVTIHHGALLPPSSYPPSVPLVQSLASLGRWEPSLYSLMSLITLCGGGGGVWMDGWTDGEMYDGKEGMGKRHIFPHWAPLSLLLMAAAINHTPALDGDLVRQIRLRLIAIMISAVTGRRSWCSFNYQGKIWRRCSNSHAGCHVFARFLCVCTRVYE